MGFIGKMANEIDKKLTDPEKVFVSDNRLNGLQLAIGDVVSPIYNRYGKVAAVQLVD